MSAYEYPLLLKSVLESGVRFAPEQKIIYRDQFEYTYTEMYQRVLQLVAGLQKLGVGQGSTVGIIEWDSYRYLEMYFGVPSAGAVMHTINPLLSPTDLVYTMLHAEDEVLIFHEDFLPLIEKIRPQLGTVKHYIIISDKEVPPETAFAELDYESLLKSATPAQELPDFDENTQATLAYTTGTTGKPKGVYFSHRQLVLHTLVESTAFGSLTDFGGITKNDVYMPMTPLFHVHAWGVPFTTTMLGLKQVYPGRYDPAMLLKLIVTNKVTFSHCVPTILQMITTAPEAKKFDLSNWKVVIGGARLPKGLAKSARDELGIKLYSGYGLSETAPLLTLGMLQPDMADMGEDEKLDYYIKTGLPVPLVKVRVATPEGEEVAHDGQERGEIQVRTPWLTPSYFKEDEKGKALWEGGWLHTGDVANVDARGYIQIVDRLKDVIKSGGEWISSLELENLISLCEGVQEVAVIGIPDEKWGERPLAVIVAKPDFVGKISVGDFKAHLKPFVEDGTLIKWAVPERYEFVESIPKTSVGKIDKKVLRVDFGGGISAE